MTPVSPNHLSQEALDDVLIGLGPAESHAHLAVCPECRAQVEVFRGDIGLFNAASMAWSKSRPQSPFKERHPARIRAAFVGWAGSAAALAAMAFGIWHYQSPAHRNQGQTAPSQLVDSEAQIVEDNQLLQAVNAAITQDEASPIEEYKILESLHTRSKAHSKKRMK
jgi:hypothetical protein